MKNLSLMLKKMFDNLHKNYVNLFMGPRLRRANLQAVCPTTVIEIWLIKNILYHILILKLLYKKYNNYTLIITHRLYDIKLTKKRILYSNMVSFCWNLLNPFLLNDSNWNYQSILASVFFQISLIVIF